MTTRYELILDLRESATIWYGLPAQFLRSTNAAADLLEADAARISDLELRIIERDAEIESLKFRLAASASAAMRFKEERDEKLCVEHSIWQRLVSSLILHTQWMWAQRLENWMIIHRIRKKQASPSEPTAP